MKIQEKNSKHYIDAKVVIIDSDEASFLYYNEATESLRYDKKCTHIPIVNKYKDIFILSDEKPIEEDLVYDYAHDKIGKFNKLVVDGGDFSDHAKKIIASTKKLETKDELLSAHENKYVPKFTRQIPKDFFEEFVEAYNSGNKITDALVEVENVNKGWQSLANSGKVGSTFVPDEFEVKVYNENFINIKSNKKDWNDLAKIGSPEKWMEVYLHYQELLLENDTREFLENIPKKSWDDIYKDVNTIEFNSKIEVFNYLKKNYNVPSPKNNN